MKIGDLSVRRPNCRAKSAKERLFCKIIIFNFLCKNALFLELQNPRAGEFRVKQAVKIKRGVFTKIKQVRFKVFPRLNDNDYFTIKKFFQE